MADNESSRSLPAEVRSLASLAATVFECCTIVPVGYPVRKKALGTPHLLCEQRDLFLVAMHERTCAEPVDPTS